MRAVRQGDLSADRQVRTPTPFQALTPQRCAIICAAKEIRTPTPFRALPPQSSASTSFAIAALVIIK